MELQRRIAGAGQIVNQDIGDSRLVMADHQFAERRVGMSLVHCLCGIFITVFLFDLRGRIDAAT